MEAPSASVAEASGDGVVETPPALDPPVTEAGHVEEPFEAPVEPGASVAEPPVAESPDIAEPSVPPQPLDPLIAPSRGDRDIIAPSRGDRDMLLEHRRHRLRADRASARTRQRGVRKLTRARVGALLALAFAIAAVWFLQALFQPFAGVGHGKVIVDIPKGSSSGTIGSILDRDGVVSSGLLLRAARVRYRQAGRAALRSLSAQARHELLSGDRRAEQAAARGDRREGGDPRGLYPPADRRARAAKTISTGSYLAASTHSSRLDPAHYGAPARTSDLEGFLFPATYEMVGRRRPPTAWSNSSCSPSSSASAPRIFVARAQLHVTPYQLLTVASMVEREAQTRARPPADRSGDLQPAARRYAAGHRRDDLLRGGAAEAGSRLHPAN